MNQQVKCCRCRNRHLESDRIAVKTTVEPRGISVTEHGCPRCRCKSYYDLTPQIAWCWRSGLIEIGDAEPKQQANEGGHIVIAEGPKYALLAALEVVARHGKGASKSKLLVPGVPEAESEMEAGNALGAWLDWCGRRKQRDGVTFTKFKG